MTIAFKKEDWKHAEEFLSEKTLGEVIAVYRRVRSEEDKEFIA